MMATQSNLQYLRKLLNWGVRDLRRHYQPLPYSDVKSFEYHRPVGYDDRPFGQKLLCRYVWIRGFDHVLCGSIRFVYDIRRALHALFPKVIDDVKGPLSSYLPKTPKRFPDEFIQSEIARKRKYNLPPSPWYSEFDDRKISVEDVDNSPSIFDYGSSLGDRLLKTAKDKALSIDVQDIENKVKGSIASVVTDERKQLLQNVASTSQSIAQTAMKGDIKGAVTSLKGVAQDLKNNEELRDKATSSVTAVQEAITAFVQGYSEGKKYEEEAQTDPKELLQRIQTSARQTFVGIAKGAREATLAEGDLSSRLQQFAEKVKTSGSSAVSKEEEEQLFREAEQWLKAQGISVKDAVEAARANAMETREAKAAKAMLDGVASRTTDMSKQAVEKAHDIKEGTTALTEAARTALNQKFNQNLKSSDDERKS